MSEPSEFHERLSIARSAVERAHTSGRAQTELILKARARQLARPAAVAGADEHIEVLAFRLGAETYAFEPQHVARVCLLDGLTPLPGVTAFVLGISRVHGEVVSVLDLRRLLELPGRDQKQRMLIVLQSPQMRFGVLADEILGIRGLPRAGLLASLPTLDEAKERYLLGVSADQIVLLDAVRLLGDDRLVIDAGRPSSEGYTRGVRRQESSEVGTG